VIQNLKWTNKSYWKEYIARLVKIKLHKLFYKKKLHELSPQKFETGW